MLTLQPFTTVKDGQFMEDLFNGYYRLYIVSNGVVIGLFRWLEEGQYSVEEIRKQFKHDGQFTGSFLLSLVDLGLLIVEGDNYQNRPLASTLLIKENPNYQGN
ncbi:hypothetical protein [Cytobacillus praedii]